MYNLLEATCHESGIIIYGNGDVAVFNWADCGDNEYPLLSPWGHQMGWPDSEEDNIIRRVKDVDDVRPYIPEKAHEPIYDANGDLPVLLGLVPDRYIDPKNPAPYRGTIWELVDGNEEVILSIITVDTWN